MLLQEAKDRILNGGILNRSLEEIIEEFDVTHQAMFNELTIGKGNTGKVLLIHLGLSLDSKLTDFDDGELKTTKFATNPISGLIEPKETIFITQISQIFDTLVSEPTLNYLDSNLYKKIKNILIVSCVKDSGLDEGKWYFKNCWHIRSHEGTNLFEIFSEDYKLICEKIKANINNNGMIHTTSGKYLQIRSKDSKPYHPIKSRLHNRVVSNKNYAFYFQRKFICDIVSGKIDVA